MTPADRAHARLRAKGVRRWVWRPASALLRPVLAVCFHCRPIGAQHIPRSGAVLVTPNHRSFLDAFLIALATDRPVYFMAKAEFFERPWQAWLFSSVGAFPVRRGASDPEALATAQALLERGEVVCIFPEGTRVRRGPLGQPKRGAARLALTCGAPVVPAAIAGSERARRGMIISPVRVRVAVGAPLEATRVSPVTAHAAQALTGLLWSQVSLLYLQMGGQVRVSGVRPASPPTLDRVAVSPERPRPAPVTYDQE